MRHRLPSPPSPLALPCALLVACAPPSLVETVDLNGDGAIEDRITSSFDEELRPLEERWDLGLDGILDTTVTYTYDGDALIAVDRVDAAGARLTAERLSWEGGAVALRRLDQDGDGVFEEERTYAWDGARLLSLTVVGPSPSVLTLTWDGGRLSETVRDDGPDGVPDERRIFEAGADGRPSRLLVDRGAEGVLDQTYTYAWDGDRLVGRSLDADGDGLPDVVDAWEASPEEGSLTRRTDLTRDGVADQEDRFDFDRDGHLLSRETTTAGGLQRVVWDGDPQSLADRELPDPAPELSPPQALPW